MLASKRVGSPRLAELFKTYYKGFFGDKERRLEQSYYSVRWGKTLQHNMFYIILCDFL